MARFTRLVQQSSTAPAKQVRPIDLVHLAKQTMGDVGLEYEVLRMFDHICGTYFARVKVAGDVSDLCRNLSSLKGAANGVGAWPLAHFVANVESQLKSGEPLDGEWIDDLGILVQETSVFISHLLQDESALGD